MCAPFTIRIWMPSALIFITLINDGTIISIAYDHVSHALYHMTHAMVHNILHASFDCYVFHAVNTLIPTTLSMVTLSPLLLMTMRTHHMFFTPARLCPVCVTQVVPNRQPDDWNLPSIYMISSVLGKLNTRGITSTTPPHLATLTPL